MTGLIHISYDNDNPTVLGREVHTMLETETPYYKWFPRMCEYGFIEGKDYATILSLRSDRLPGKPRTDHQLTIDMAKQLCMIQRTDKGRQCREYFISVENQWNTPEAVMARALRMADKQLREITRQNIELQAINSELTVRNQISQPKAEYFDNLVDRNLLTNFRETAKLLNVGERIFVSLLLEKKYVYRDKRKRLTPYARKNKGLFETKEYFTTSSNWKATQTLITPKGRETFRLLCQGLSR